MTIASNIERIKKRVKAACKRANRSPDEVKIVAVSKLHPVEKIIEAYSNGLRIFGENRVQEAKEKFEILKDYQIEWHLIGHLQKNKVKYAVNIFDFIHSIDSIELAEKVEKRLEKIGKTIKGFIQVKLSEEETKHGVLIEELDNLARFCRNLNYVKIIGLMTVPPYFDDVEKVRPYFVKLRELRDKLNKEVFENSLTELSMGMTHDFEVAIEEGATYVRIGTGIFGERNYDGN
ncbi:PLP dependent protein [Thermotomaculum hydrothermale]|uniref:Pyridoxal phosphate homeostasis protein n=1 Tax=Thermotomaculum hydrothermale TaxID=981385 RepID=A0A7R6PLS2_9BACT|nr:YggS family pyridoxal phosphate-dependent enzyme [Thermotomaculum hydrothermale]BBB31913.1 PLP dependent protein [Thermotomaculum hydrothermale]